MTSYDSLDKIKNRLLEFCTLFSFSYHGKSCDIDPFDEGNFHLRCGDKEQDVDSIDAVLYEPFFDNRSLADIVNDITNIEG